MDSNNLKVLLSLFYRTKAWRRCPLSETCICDVSESGSSSSFREQKNFYRTRGTKDLVNKAARNGATPASFPYNHHYAY